MSDPIDEYAIQQVKEFEGKKLKCCTKEGLQLEETEDEKKKKEEVKAAFEALCRLMKDILGDKVEKVVVSDRIVDSPCVLVTGEYGWSANMERIMKAQALRDNSMSAYMSSKKTLEINPHHPVMQILLERVKEGNGDLDEASVEYADLMFNMAILNSGFIVENPMDLTEPLEKLIKVGFGLSRDAPIEEIEVNIDDSEDDEESGDSGEDIDLDYDDEVDYEEMMIDDL